MITNPFTQFPTKESQPKPTDSTSTLEMLFGEKNRDAIYSGVPQVPKHAEQKILNTKSSIDQSMINAKNTDENMFNAKDLDENMLNDKVSVEKMFNGKNSFKNMFKTRHSVDNTFNTKVSVGNILNDNDSVENMFNVQHDKLFPQSVKPEEEKPCCCPKDTISTKLS